MSTIEQGEYANFAEGAERPTGLFYVLYHDWRLIGVITILVLAISIGVSFLLPVSYRASVQLFPTPQADVPRLSASSLLGLGSTASTTTDESLAILVSEKFLSGFLLRHGYLPLLYPRDWDSATNSWKNGHGPSVQQMASDFNQNLKVETKPTTAVVTVSYEDTDAARAAKILNELIVDLNVTMQTAAIYRSQMIVREYNSELQSNSVSASDVREHLVLLITNEMKSLVTARATPNYAFRVVDPAFPPDRKSAPQRGMITVAGLFLGLFAGILVAMGRRFLKDLRRRLS
jgi:uncharacterized protein involved in exopolysaccharide biosynthesis